MPFPLSAPPPAHHNQAVYTRGKSTVLFFVLLLAGTLPGQGLDLVHSGASDYSILGDPSDPAVLDLQHYLAEIGGATLPVLPLDANPLPTRAIVVGDRVIPGYVPPTLTPQGYHLKVVGDDLVIRGGGEQGTQFGVYGLLDDHLGCRWLTPEFEVVPATPTVSIPDILDEIREPSIRDRGHIGGDFGTIYQSGIDWRRRNRVGVDMNGGAYHNMYTLLPPSEYFADHPEWYPLTPSGRREANAAYQCMTWSNPDMIAELTRVVKDVMAVTPPDTLVTVAQGDGHTPSYDPLDRALVAQYGSESAPLIYCMNEVLRETKKEYPNHCIVTFAYQGTHLAPVNHASGEVLIPDSNLHIEWVRQADNMHDINTGPVNESHRDEFLEWTTLTPNLRVWEWAVGFQAMISPFPNYKEMGQDIQLFSSHVRGFRLQGSAFRSGDWGEMRGWMSARLQWDASLDVETVERDFVDHYFGANAGSHIWQYLTEVQARVDSSTAVFNSVFGSQPSYVKHELFPGSTLDDGLQHFEDALSAAHVTGQPEYRTHIRDTRASSLAYLLYVPPQPLQPVDIDGERWLLPNGEVRFATIGEDIAEIMKIRLLYEYSNPWFGRQDFVAKAGGICQPTLENGRIRVEFNPNLRGIISSLYDKQLGQEILSIGPSAEPSAGGLRDSIFWGVHNVSFSDASTPGVGRVTSEASVITNPYLEVESLFRQRRTVEMPEAGARFTVRQRLYTDPAGEGLARAYHQPVYNINLSEPFYNGGLLARLNVWNASGPRVTVLAPNLIYSHDFSSRDTFHVPVPGDLDGDEALALYVINGPFDPVSVIETPWSDWAELRFNHDAVTQQLVLTGTTPNKTAVYTHEVPMTEYTFRVLTSEEADRELPVSRIHASPGDGQVTLEWEGKSFPEFGGYNVYSSTSVSGPYGLLPGSPISATETVIGGLSNGTRYYFHVTVLDTILGEGDVSPLTSAVPRTGTPTEFLVANTGIGDFLTIQEAFDALPTSNWSSDYTISILDTSSLWTTGYLGARISDAAAVASVGHRLTIRGEGGMPIVNSVIDLNGSRDIGSVPVARVTVAVTRIRFHNAGESNAFGIEGPGSGSLISENRFEGWGRAVALNNYAGNSGTIVERNSFDGGPRIREAAIVDAGGASGGEPGNPLVIRNNFFSRVRKAVFVSNPAHTYIVNNTFLATAERTLFMVPESTLTVKNNLFSSISTMSYALLWSASDDVVAASVPWDHNLFHDSTIAGMLPDIYYWSLPLWQSEVGKDPNSLQTDPLLLPADWQNDPQFTRLQFEPDSPAIDAGARTGVPYGEFDFFGNPRLTGDGIDIGAFEHPHPFQYRLVVSASHGLIIADPDLQLYDRGAVVRLTTLPEGGFEFVEWFGDVPSGQESLNPLDVTMDRNRVIGAVFQQAVLRVPDWGLF